MGLGPDPARPPLATGMWTSHWMACVRGRGHGQEGTGGVGRPADRSRTLLSARARQALTPYPVDTRGRAGGRQGGRFGCSCPLGTPLLRPIAPAWWLMGGHRKCPGQRAGGHSPCSQWTPVLPGGQVHVPFLGSQVAPCPHLHTWAQLGPKRPCGQAAGRKWEGGRPGLDPSLCHVGTRQDGRGPQCLAPGAEAACSPAPRGLCWGPGPLCRNGDSLGPYPAPVGPAGTGGKSPHDSGEGRALSRVPAGLRTAEHPPLMGGTEEGVQHTAGAPGLRDPGSAQPRVGGRADRGAREGAACPHPATH